MIDMNRVLVVAAHPDDEVLGCGATIRKLVESGAEVRILILGEGSSCRYSTDQIRSNEVREAILQRRAFADQAIEVLGVTDAWFVEFPCGRFDTVPVIEIGKTIEFHIADFLPDTVITHHGQDTNSDHRITFNAVNTATRPVPGNCVRTVLAFETPSSTEWRFVDTFQPSLFVDVSNQIGSKISAFNCYFETEGRAFPFPRSPEGLTTLARLRGMQVGVEAAEAFVIVRTMIMKCNGSD